MNKHAFPPTGFAVACLDCLLHLVAVVLTARMELLYPCSPQAKTRGGGGGEFSGRGEVV